MRFVNNCLNPVPATRSGPSRLVTAEVYCQPSCMMNEFRPDYAIMPLCFIYYYYEQI